MIIENKQTRFHFILNVPNTMQTHDSKGLPFSIAVKEVKMFQNKGSVIRW